MMPGNFRTGPPNIPLKNQLKCGEFSFCDDRIEYCAGDIHVCGSCQRLCPDGTGCAEYCPGYLASTSLANPSFPSRTVIQTIQYVPITPAAAQDGAATDGISRAEVAGIATAIVIMILIIMAIVVSIYRSKRRKRRRQTTDQENIPLENVSTLPSDDQPDRDLQGVTAASTAAAAAAAAIPITADDAPQVPKKAAEVPAFADSIRTNPDDATSAGTSRGGGPASSNSWSQCRTELPPASMGTSAYQSQTGAQSNGVTYAIGECAGAGPDVRPKTFPPVASQHKPVQEVGPRGDHPETFVKESKKIRSCLPDSGFLTIDNRHIDIDENEDQRPPRNSVAMETTFRES